MEDGRSRTVALPTVPAMTDDGLRVDTCRLRQLGEDLRAVRAELAAAEAVADPPDDVLAHGALRERLQHCGAGWDGRRVEALHALDGLEATAVRAAGTYERLETVLVAALRGAA